MALNKTDRQLMNNTLIDNSIEQLSMSSTLKKCFQMEGLKMLRIATGYWDMPGMSIIVDELEAFLQKEGTKLELLIGKDPYVYINQLKEPKYKDASYPHDFIRTDINELELKEKYKKAVDLLLKHCTNKTDSKIEIKIYRRNKEDDVQFLHSKCYIFCSEIEACGIIGSSNFTQKGLQGNAELNYLESSWIQVMSVDSGNPNQKSHKIWFEEKWAQSSIWNKEFIEQILKPSPIGVKVVQEQKRQREEDEKISPYELYIKLLQYKFGDLVDKNLGAMIESYLPDYFDRYEYQIDAVKQCFNIMKEHGGFMLADVVGLGKTIVGTLIIKHFLSLPDDDGRDRSVLLITPPAIQSTWKDTIKRFDENQTDKIASNIDFLTTGRITQLLDEVEDNEEDIDQLTDDGADFERGIKQRNYGLILIDESHKFRNNNTSMYKALDDLIAQIGSDTGAYPYIGLLSATPQNNRPDDLKNQIYLFQRNHKDSTLKKANGGDLEAFFARISRKFGLLINLKENIADADCFTSIDKKERQLQLKEISRELRDDVLSDILVRRTRTDVKKYYESDLQKQSLTFPSISGPHSLVYTMPKRLAELFSRTMEIIAHKELFNTDYCNYLSYYRYRAIEFFSDEDVKSLYAGGNLEVDRFSHQLARIMQINLVKRLESSFSAFKASLHNLRRYTKNMIDMWEHNVIFVCPQININAELNPRKHYDRTHRILSFEECAQDIRRKIEKLNAEGRNENNRNREFRRQDFQEKYIQLLRKDYNIIDGLCTEWDEFPGDPKLDVFRDSLESVLFDKSRNPVQKLVIFTEAIDTINSIRYVVEQKGYSTLVVTSQNRKDLENRIRDNFDANVEPQKQKNDYQVIITTEVLAEGINLHRANCILNYDTPWNSTRLMQRIGRVNRIGSTAPVVYVYNFMPSAEGDAQIQLVNKAYTKLQSFHTLFGEDSRIFSEEEELSHYDLNTQINGEESPMEKYVYQLKAYKAKHPQRYDFLEKKNEGLELAANAHNSNSYFLVRTPKMSGMFVEIDEVGKDRIISASEMYDRFFSTPSCPSYPLPDNWEDQKKKAERAVNQQLNKMNIHTRHSQRATLAKEILKRMNEEQNMSPDSKDLLANAYKLVNKGNMDIIKKIIYIDQQMRNAQGMLFAYTQADFDAMVKAEIEKMVENVQRKHGVAHVFIGLAK